MAGGFFYGYRFIPAIVLRAGSWGIFRGGLHSVNGYSIINLPRGDVIGYNPASARNLSEGCVLDMLRFVIQQHECDSQRHWDLMLENGPALATWQVNKQPDLWPGESVVCHKIADHRMKYLSYQGPISNQRGDVHIVAAGTYQLLEAGENKWHLVLCGDKISGELELTLLEDNLWQLDFEGKVIA